MEALRNKSLHKQTQVEELCPDVAVSVKRAYSAVGQKRRTSGRPERGPGKRFTRDLSAVSIWERVAKSIRKKLKLLKSECSFPQGAAASVKRQILGA